MPRVHLKRTVLHETSPTFAAIAESALEEEPVVAKRDKKFPFRVCHNLELYGVPSVTIRL